MTFDEWVAGLSWVDGLGYEIKVRGRREYYRQVWNAARFAERLDNADRTRAAADDLPDYKTMWLAEQAKCLAYEAEFELASKEVKPTVTKEWCMNMARLEGDSEIGACDPMKYPRICGDSKDGVANLLKAVRDQTIASSSLWTAARNLMRLKDLKDRIARSLSYPGRGNDEQEYAGAKAAAWDALRAALASQVAPSKQAPHGERIDPLKALACMVLDAESGKTDQINSYAGVLRFVYDAVAASQAAPEAPAAAAHAGATVRYVVIGYGESDNPQATFAQTSDELLDAVLGMIYTSPSDAPEDIREAYRSDLTDDSDEWCGNVWRTEFEIGGIVIYDLGEPVLTAPAPDMAADTNFLDDLRRKIAAAPRRQFESAPGVYTSWLDQDAVLDIFDAARGESV